MQYVWTGLGYLDWNLSPQSGSGPHTILTRLRYTLYRQMIGTRVMYSDNGWVTRGVSVPLLLSKTTVSYFLLRISSIYLRRVLLSIFLAL